jgi:hypothetical protein
VIAQAQNNTLIARAAAWTPHVPQASSEMTSVVSTVHSIAPNMTIAHTPVSNAGTIESAAFPGVMRIVVQRT